MSCQSFESLYQYRLSILYFWMYSFGISFLLILSPQNAFCFRFDIVFLIAFFSGLFSARLLNAFSVSVSANIMLLAGLKNFISIFFCLLVFLLVRDSRCRLCVRLCRRRFCCRRRDI